MFYRFVRFLVGWLLRLLYRVHIAGIENIPESGGCIIASNHTSLMDPVILGVVEKRQIHFMAKAELFKIPLLNSIIRALGAFPVHRAEGDVTAIKHTIETIAEGKLLCIFPQGTRCGGVPVRETADKLKSGIGLIAMRAESPVVPVLIKTKANKLHMFRRTDVIFGTVIKPDEFMSFDGRNKYKDTSKLIFDRICELEAS